MKSLILDTSHSISYITITNDNEIIFFKKIENNLNQNIFLDLKKAIKEISLQINDLSFIALSIGPGSFTALRTSAVIAKTLNFTHNIPLVGYNSLMAYPPQKDESFCIIFDAKSDGIFLLEGTFKNNKINYKKNTLLLSIDDAKKIFENIDVILTPDFEKVIKKFESYKEKIKPSSFDPFHIMNLTQKLYDEKKYFNHSNLNLLYLRGPNHIE